jgi:hypothetical protein
VEAAVDVGEEEGAVEMKICGVDTRGKVDNAL